MQHGLVRNFVNLKIWKFSKLKITTRSHAAWKGDSGTILATVGGVRPKNVVIKYMKNEKRRFV
jgi:hypothetical protein